LGEEGGELLETDKKFSWIESILDHVSKKIMQLNECLTTFGKI
jgi:hypothetical protein